jgi:hypothetical protein
MSDPLAIANAYIRLWNESDPQARRRLFAEHWTADASYVDPLAQAKGAEELSALIGGVQERFPQFRFSLLGQPDAHGENLRFSWGLGPDGAEPPIKGTDFARLDGGRLGSVVGFLDQVPA